MGRHISFIRRCILFALLLCVSLGAMNKVLEPKYTFRNSNWPTTSTFEQFYRMKKDSADVLFFGSSFAVNAFSPQEIYEYNGIRSYNLGSEQQSIFMSYAWLREALKYQSPQAVVLECRYAFYKESNTPFNMNESFMRKSMDPMHIGRVKAETVRTICAKDPAQSRMSYYFTNLMYHTRWKEAGEADLFERAADAPMKGYSPLYVTDTDPFEPVRITDPSYLIPADALMIEYLDKMCALCAENNIRLILVTVPATDMHEGMHNTLQRYADEHGVVYYDIGEEGFFRKAGFDTRTENPADHMNRHGSVRMSRLMADILHEEYGIQGKKDSQWEDSRAYYEVIRRAGEYSAITDPAEYFSRLEDSGLIVFAANDAGSFLPGDIAAKLGIPGGDRSDALVLVRDAAGIHFPEAGRAVLQGWVSGLRYTVKAEAGESVIELDGADQCRKGKGLHVTVYDPDLAKTVDEVCFIFGDSPQALRD